jgi:hypothetical protein
MVGDMGSFGENEGFEVRDHDVELESGFLKGCFLFWGDPDINIAEDSWMFGPEIKIKLEEMGVLIYIVDFDAKDLLVFVGL